MGNCCKSDTIEPEPDTTPVPTPDPTPTPSPPSPVPKIRLVIKPSISYQWFIKERSHNIWKDYEKKNTKLGTGQFAQVEVAVHRLTGKEVAIKIPIRDKGDNEVEKYRKEIDFLKRLVSFPNLKSTHYFKGPSIYNEDL